MKPGGVSDVTHRKRGLRFEKKQLVEFLRPNGKVEIQTWARPDDFVRYGRRAFVGVRADDIKAVSIERLYLSHSLLMSKTFKLKGNNFASWQYSTNCCQDVTRKAHFNRNHIKHNDRTKVRICDLY